MIVIAILGILLAIAIPAYNDYTIRAKVGEGLVVATGAKSAVSETRISRSVWPTDNQEAGIRGNISSTYVTSVEVSAGGIITLVYRNVDSQVDGNALELEPTFLGGTVQWTCRGATSGPIDRRFLPANCR
jgi:type IV pilus assembly protein PilA